MISKQKEYSSDFEIGNATMKEVASSFFGYDTGKYARPSLGKILLNLPGYLARSVDKNIMQQHVDDCTNKDVFGMGCNGLWCVRVGNITEHFRNSFFSMNVRDNPELKKALEGSNKELRTIYFQKLDAVRLGCAREDKGVAEGIKEAGCYGVVDVYTRKINSVVLEEVSHALGYRHGCKDSDKREAMEFFDDVAMHKKVEPMTVDVD